MKRFSFLIALILVLLMAAPVLASDVSDARYHGVVKVTNNSTAATNVSTNFTLSTASLLSGVYADSSTDFAMQYDDNDVAFQPSVNSTYPWSVWVPSIAESSISDYDFYSGDVTGGKIRYFPGDEGMEVDDDATLELSDNFTIEQAGWLDTTNVGANITAKQDAIRVYVSGTGNVTAKAFGQDNYQIPDDTTGSEGGWSDPDNAIDDDTNTYAEADWLGAGYSDNLTFNLDTAVDTDEIKYYFTREAANIDEVQIDVYNSTNGWVNVYDGVVGSTGTWISVPFTTEEDITSITFRFNNNHEGYGYWCRVHEVLVNSNSISTTVTNITSGEHTITTSSLQTGGGGGGSSHAADHMRIIGYYMYYNDPPWNENGANMVSQIDWYDLTDIIYQWTEVNTSTGAIVRPDNWLLSSLDTMSQTAIANDTDIWLGIAGSSSLDTVWANSSLRATYITNLIEFCRNHGLAGVVANCEPMADVSHFNSFLADFTAATDIYGNHYKVAMAASAREVDINATSIQYLDFIAVMGYDIWWTGHGNAEHGRTQDVIYALQMYENAGAPRDKLCMGVPFYGKNEAEAIFKYYYLYDTYSPTPDQDWFNSNTIWMNNIDTLQKKTAYVAAMGYQGMMIWELPFDLVDGDVTPEDSLLLAMNNYGVEDIYYENYFPYTGYSADDFEGTRWIAQTFTPTVSHTVTSVELWLYRNANPTGNLDVVIKAVDGSHKPTGAALASGSITISSMTAGSYDEYTVDLGAGAAVTAYTEYAIVFSAPSMGDNCYYRGMYGTGTYSRGLCFASDNSGTSWYTNSINDIYFAESGDSPDPEEGGETYTWLHLDIDGVSYSNAYPLTAIPNNSNDWYFCQSDAMPYVEYVDIEVDEEQVGHWEWEYAETFTDSSGNDNTATPTFRTASSDADVSASIVSLDPISVSLPDITPITIAAGMVTDIPDPIEQLYTEGNYDSIVGSEAVNEILNTSDVPEGLWWYPFLFLTIGVIGFIVYQATRIGGATGSLLTMCIVCELLLATFGLLNPIPLWPAILFPIPAVALILSQKHYSWG